MIRFGYHAYNAAGKLVRGEIASESRELALAALRRRGEFPLEIFEGQAPRRERWWERDLALWRSGMSQSGLALFTRELATLLRAELPLDEALRIVALQPAMPASARRITRAILERVLEGQSLSQALAAQDGAIPEHHWRLVQGGEASGGLSDVLDDLAGYLERMAETRSRIASAMLYPCILIAMSVLALATITMVLLPMIVPLLRGANAELPFVIGVLNGLQEAVAASWPAIGAAAVLAAIGAVQGARSGALGAGLSRLALSTPVARGLVIQREVSKYSRTMATLLKGGVPLLEAARIAGGALSNRAFRSAAATVTEELKEGAPLTRPLTASGLFPELALRLIAIGEQTGQLEAMLARVATIFEAAFQRRIDRLTTLLTPALTLGVGLFVGGLMVSVMSALLSVNDIAAN